MKKGIKKNKKKGINKKKKIETKNIKTVQVLILRCNCYKARQEYWLQAAIAKPMDCNTPTLARASLENKIAL